MNRTRYATREKHGQIAFDYSGSLPQSAAALPNADRLRTRPRGRPSIRRLASVRLAEMYRLGRYRSAHDLSFNAGAFAFALAATLGCDEGERAFVPGRGRRSLTWHGLDMLTLREAVRRSHITVHEETLISVLERVTRWQARNGAKFMTAASMGEIIELTSCERQECRIRTIDACDEPKAEREARIAEERRARDRETKRAQRRARHVPRDVYLAHAEKRRSLCREHGISDRTLTRWIKAGKVDVRSLSAHDIYSYRERTEFGHGVIPGRATDLSGAPDDVETKRKSHIGTAAEPPYARAASDRLDEPDAPPLGRLGAQGPARTAKATRTAGAAGPAPGGKLKAGQASRTVAPPLPKKRFDNGQPDLDLFGGPEARAVVSDGLPEAVRAYTGGIMPATVRAIVLDTKRRRGLRDEDIARELGVSRPQFVNVKQARFGFSKDAAVRLKQWLTAA